MSNSVIENIAHGLKITYWNINGLLRKDEDYCKLKDPLFIDQVDKYDIIGLSEIHCGSEEILEYTGYRSELSTRPKLAKARKFSGGLLILIKSQISKGIKRIKSNPGNYI
jgi:exonuclease III